MKLSQTLMSFSHSQFAVFDASVAQPFSFHWQQVHVDQGFARRARNVCFGTLIEFGLADLSIHFGPFSRALDAERVIEVPLYVTSKEVGIEAVEEWGTYRRRVKVEPGHYRLVVAQSIQDVYDDYGADGYREQIDIYLERLRQPLQRSSILVADAALNPPDVLVEHADPLELP